MSLMSDLQNNQEIEIGNAIAEGQDGKRGWFIGAFVSPTTPLKTTNDIEVKWGIHPKGEIRSSKAAAGDAKTISLLIRGKYRITFDHGEEIVLSNEGDYVIWSPNIPHESETYEDSVIVTIRWPSLSASKN